MRTYARSLELTLAVALGHITQRCCDGSFSFARAALVALVMVYGLVACDPRPPAKQSEERNSGLPPPTRVWNAEDYRQAAALIQDGRVPLPSTNDPAGNAILARITNAENLAFLKNERTGLNVRFKDWLSISESTKAILRAYFAEVRSNEKYSSELLRLISFQLQVSAQGLPLVDRASGIASVAAKNPTKVVEEAATLRKHFRDGAFVAMASLEETELFSQSDRSRLLGVMAEAVPQLLPVLSKEDRDELAARLQARKDPKGLLVDYRNIDSILRALGQ